MTPEQIADVLERLARVEQQLDDYKAYLNAMRRRIDRLESPQLPYAGGQGFVADGYRRWR